MSSEVHRLANHGSTEASLALACFWQHLGFPAPAQAVPTTFGRHDIQCIVKLFAAASAVAATGPALLSGQPSAASAAAAWSATMASAARTDPVQHVAQLGWLSRPAERGPGSDYELSMPSTGALLRYVRGARKEIVQYIKVCAAPMLRFAQPRHMN